MKTYSKRQILLLLIKNLNYIFHNAHIYSVMNIFLQEVKKELLLNKKIKIGNFGTFNLVDLKSKKIKSVKDGSIKNTKSSKSLRFKISKKLSKYMLENKEK